MFVKFVLLQGAQLGWNEIFKESLPPVGNRLSTNDLEDKKREKIPALGWTQTHDLLRPLKIDNLNTKYFSFSNKFSCEKKVFESKSMLQRIIFAINLVPSIFAALTSFQERLKNRFVVNNI